MGIRTTGFKSELKRGCRAERRTSSRAAVPSEEFIWLRLVFLILDLWLGFDSWGWGLCDFHSLLSTWDSCSFQVSPPEHPIVLLLQSRRRDALQSHKAVFDYTFSGFRPRLCQCKRLNMCLICRACDKWLPHSMYYIVHMHMALQLFPPSLAVCHVDLFKNCDPASEQHLPRGAEGGSVRLFLLCFLCWGGGTINQ